MIFFIHVNSHAFLHVLLRGEYEFSSLLTLSHNVLAFS